MSEFLWPLVGCFGIGALSFSFRVWLDRIHPQHEPDPSAPELLAAMDELKEEVRRDMDNIRGKMDLRGQGRAGTRS